MNNALVKELYDTIDAMPILDIHTHVNWKTGTASSIGDILSYHYYTELTNSAEYVAGEFPFEDPRALTEVILPKLALIRNTVQYDWLMTISREYLGLGPDEWTADNGSFVFDRSVEIMDRPAWRDELIAQSNIVKVFLTNEYDDDLENLPSFYAPCLRTETFVTGIDAPGVLAGMGEQLGRPVTRLADLTEMIDKVFARFVSHGMGYAAISSPAGFQTYVVADDAAQAILSKVAAGSPLDADERELWGAYAMRRICDACQKFAKPYHLMIGVTRGMYEQGVPSGQDLFDSVNSMAGYTEMFNDYPDVSFPTSVLSDTSGLELTAASWIRHNVYPSGHWWYGNQPTDMARELRRRLDVVPQNKIIGYYSDAYYLEFVMPKFRMFKFELAAVLADRMERSLIHPNMEVLSLADALQLAEDVLLNNPMRILGIQSL